MAASNTVLTTSIIANEALLLLKNNLKMAGAVYRGYEKEFDKRVNGYKVGETISIRRPALGVVRSGPVAAPQDMVEGTFALSVDTQEGADLQFSSRDMTMSISDFSERFLKSHMIKLANSVDSKLTALYKRVWNWVGTPGQAINSYADFILGPQRLDEMSVPEDDRYGLLYPTEYWGMVGSLSGVYVNDVASGAIKRGSLPMLGDIKILKSQNTAFLTTGTRDNTTPTVNGANQNVTYAASKATYTQSLITAAWDNNATIEAGMVFTIADVYAVNPVSKVALSFLQQFVVTAAVTASGAGAATLVIAPPIITSGAYQTVSAIPASGAAIVTMGAASTNYPQNMVFHKNAFTLVMVPMEEPEGAVKVSRMSSDGISVRLIPYYDGTNDFSNWRLDILYGVAAIDPRLATRISGTA